MGVYALGDESDTPLDPAAAAYLLLTSPLVVEDESGEMAVACPADYLNNGPGMPVVYRADAGERTMPLEDLLAAVGRAREFSLAIPVGGYNSAFLRRVGRAIPPRPGRFFSQPREVSNLAGLYVASKSGYAGPYRLAGLDEAPVEGTASTFEDAPRTKKYEKSELPRLYLTDEGVIVRSLDGDPLEPARPVGELKSGDVYRLRGEISDAALDVLLGLAESVGAVRFREEFEVFVGRDGSIEVSRGTAPADRLLPALISGGLVKTTAVVADSRDPGEVGRALVRGACTFEGDGFVVSPRTHIAGFRLVSKERHPIEPAVWLDDVDAMADAINAIVSSDYGIVALNEFGALAVRDAIAALGGAAFELDTGFALTVAAAAEGGEGWVASRLILARRDGRTSPVDAAAAASRNTRIVALSAGSPGTIESPAWLIPYLNRYTLAWTEDGVWQVLVPNPPWRSMSLPSVDDLLKITHVASPFGAEHLGADALRETIKSAEQMLRIQNVFELAAIHGKVAVSEAAAVAAVGDLSIFAAAEDTLSALLRGERRLSLRWASKIRAVAFHSSDLELATRLAAEGAPEEIVATTLVW